jgi:hypothetical protein
MKVLWIIFLILLNTVKYSVKNRKNILDLKREPI